MDRSWQTGVGGQELAEGSVNLLIGVSCCTLPRLGASYLTGVAS